MAFQRRTLTRFTILLLLSCLTLVNPVQAQDPSGRPTDPKSEGKKAGKKPVKPPVRRADPPPATVTLTVLTDPPDVAVLVEGEDRGASNGEGKLVIERLRLGHYTIEARKDGYRPMTRGFNAGTEAPTVVFKLEPDLDPYVSKFDSLVGAGKLVGPDSPNALEVVTTVQARFPERPEVQRMRGVLGTKLIDAIAPVITNSATNWRAVSRDELAKASIAAETAVTLRKEDNRLRAEAAYLKGAVLFRDWQSAASGVAGGDGKIHSAGSETGAPSLPQARAELENAVRFDEAFAPARLLLGLTLMSMQEWPAAEGTLIRVTQLEPHWVQGVISLGAVYQSEAKYKESIETFRRALQLEPQNARAHAGLGLARVMKGEKDGVKDLEKAAQLDPNSATVQLNLGLGLSQSKDKKQRKRAEDALQKALDLNAKNVEFPAAVAERALEALKKK